MQFWANVVKSHTIYRFSYFLIYLDTEIHLTSLLNPWILSLRVFWLEILRIITHLRLKSKKYYGWRAIFKWKLMYQWGKGKKDDAYLWCFTRYFLVLWPQSLCMMALESEKVAANQHRWSAVVTEWSYLFFRWLVCKYDL